MHRLAYRGAVPAPKCRARYIFFQGSKKATPWVAFFVETLLQACQLC